MASTISANSAGGGGLVTSGDASGVLNLQTASVTALSIDASQKVTFTNSLTLPTLTSPIIAGTPTGVGVLTSGTAVASTSGTSIDFTGIPSWVKRITVVLNGVSTSGTSPYLVQLGTSSGIDTTGYVSAALAIQVSAVSSSANTSTAGFLAVVAQIASTELQNGHIIITNISGNIWVQSGNVPNYAATRITIGGGTKTTASTLDRLRITTVNGTDTFDAGSINIMYE